MSLTGGGLGECCKPHQGGARGTAPGRFESLLFLVPRNFLSFDIQQMYLNCLLWLEKILKYASTQHKNHPYESAESIQNCKGGTLQIFQLNQDTKLKGGTITDFSAESRLNLAEISF